jgi:hypothetical protein
VLTDVFHRRYRDREIFAQAWRGLNVQCYRILDEQLNLSSAIWADIERKVSMELGVEHLWTKVQVHRNGRYIVNHQEMCRHKGAEVQAANHLLAARLAENTQVLDALAATPTVRRLVAARPSAEAIVANEKNSKNFDAFVHELNVRLGQCGVPCTITTATFKSSRTS